ncbi:hypothetical protein RI367_000996 [Sorochytrium milnesiophthora]
MTDVAADAPPRRSKRLLKDYYGIAAAADTIAPLTEEDAPLAPKKNDPLDLDSDAFEVDRYCKLIWNEKHLPGLLKRDNELITEMKELDGDMKTLVYENYTKFINASDTIHKMKLDVDDMEIEMNKLKENVRSITASAQNIHQGMAERKQRIRQLRGVSQLLQKLHFIFELPTRLRAALPSVQQYPQAVKYYATTASLLRHYAHVSIFKKIAEECDVITGKMQARLHQELASDKIHAVDVVNIIGMLIGLGRDPPEALSKLSEALLAKASKDLFAAIQQWEDKGVCPSLQLPPSTDRSSALARRRSMSTSKLRQSRPLQAASGANGSSARLLSPALASTMTPTEDAAEGGSKPRPSDKVDLLDRLWLQEFVVLAGKYKLHFLDEGSDVGSVPKYFVASSAQGNAANFKTGFDDFVRNETQQLLTMMGSCAVLPEDIHELDTHSAHAFLDALYETVQSNDVLTPLGVDRQVKSNISGWLERAMTLAFSRVRSECMHMVTTTFIKDQAPTIDVSQFPEALEKLFVDQMKDKALNLISRLSAPTFRFLHNARVKNAFDKQLRRQLGEFFPALFQQISEYIFPPRTTLSVPFSPSVVLAISRFMTDLAAGLSDQIFYAYSTTFFPLPEVQMTNAMLGARPETNRTLMEGQLLAEDAAAACEVGTTFSKRLVTRYVDVVANNISKAIQDFVEGNDWLKSPAPERVSPVFADVVGRFQTAEREVNTLCGAYELGSTENVSGGASGGTSGDNISEFGPGRGRRGHRHTQSASSVSSYHHHHHNPSSSHGSGGSGRSFSPPGTVDGRSHFFQGIDKMFRDKMEFFGDVNASRPAILAAVLRIVLKAWVERVRETTLNRFAFQQTIVDVEYCKTHLRKYASGDRQISDLLDEVLTSAYRRCTDPVFLQRDSINTLLSGGEMAEES